MKESIINYLKNKYDPLAILLYGSFADGLNDAFSDFDCMVIVREKTAKHDSSVVAGIQLDCYIFTAEETEKEDAETFLTAYDAEIVFDSLDGIGAALKARVRKYVEENTDVGEEEKKFIASWIVKTMKRAKKNDDEGSFRALAFLWESLADYYILRGKFYFGSKKAVNGLKENDPEGYALYHAAITERTNKAIEKWADYVIKETAL